MSFVRRKKIHGNHYYQLVRNYREGGRHRQQVLCHLGIYDSVEGAIVGAKQRAVHYQDTVAAKREEADLIQSELQAHGHATEEIYDIFSRAEASEEVQRLRWFEPYRYEYHRDEEEWERRKEKWDADMRVAQLRFAHQEALGNAEYAERLRSKQQERLNKLLECQRN